MSRKSLLKRQAKPVEINGGTVFVRSLTLREALHVDTLAKSVDTEKEVLAYMVSRAVVDADGVPVFAENDPEIADIPVDVLRELGDVIRKQMAMGSVDKAEKN